MVYNTPKAHNPHTLNTLIKEKVILMAAKMDLIYSTLNNLWVISNKIVVTI